MLVPAQKTDNHRKCAGCEAPGTVTYKGGHCAACFATDLETTWARWPACNGPGCLRERATCRTKREKTPKGCWAIEEEIARRDDKALRKEGDKTPTPELGETQASSSEGGHGWDRPAGGTGQEDHRPRWHERGKPSLRSREEAQYGPIRWRHDARVEVKKGPTRETQNRVG